MIDEPLTRVYIILNVFHIYASERARLRSASRPRSVADMCYAQYPATIRLLLSLRPADRAVLEHLTHVHGPHAPTSPPGDARRSAAHGDAPSLRITRTRAASTAAPGELRRRRPPFGMHVRISRFSETRTVGSHRTRGRRAFAFHARATGTTPVPRRREGAAATRRIGENRLKVPSERPKVPTPSRRAPRADGARCRARRHPYE